MIVIKPYRKADTLDRQFCNRSQFTTLMKGLAIEYTKVNAQVAHAELTKFLLIPEVVCTHVDPEAEGYQAAIRAEYKPKEHG
jgi:hypothetical protein